MNFMFSASTEHFFFRCLSDCLILCWKREAAVESRLNAGGTRTLQRVYWASSVFSILHSCLASSWHFNYSVTKYLHSEVDARAHLLGRDLFQKKFWKRIRFPVLWGMHTYGQTSPNAPTRDRICENLWRCEVAHLTFLDTVSEERVNLNIEAYQSPIHYLLPEASINGAICQ